MTQKTILITGCSSGIGLCVAKALHKRNYRVFATARKTTDVDKLNEYLKEKKFKTQFINYNKEILGRYLKKVDIKEPIHKKNATFYMNYIKNGEIPNYESFYSDELILKVFDFYKQDFNKLGYYN